MAYNGDRSTYYYERETSLKILKKLLMYQNDNNEEAYIDFIKSLYRLLNRKNGKKNTMLFVGEPNSLKTTFVM